MLYANDLLDRTPVSPYQTDAHQAACPGCGGLVHSKFPTQALAHWAHHPGEYACNYVGESDWHLGWKSAFADVGKLEYVRGGRRTDLWTTVRGCATPGRAFEFQKGPLDIETMQARQRAWKNVVWVIDGRDAKITHLDHECVSWDRVPQMVWKGINQWNGCGAQMYIHARGDLMLDVREVEFGKGIDGAALVMVNVETRESFIARYRADALMPLWKTVL